MTQITRYALYYAPPEQSALAQFGAAWLGWDAAAGAETAHPEIAGLPRPAAELTRTPRKYGFHGTLKPPFRLAEGQTEEALLQAVADLAADRPAFPMPGLRLQGLGAFLALIPDAPSPALADLAAAAVTGLDRFRAPAGEAELAKRRRPGLTPAQEKNLTDWGYPYVLGEFRFHLTLSGAFEPAVIDRTAAALDPVLAPILAEQPPEAEICLFAEIAGERFHILRRFPLTG